MHRVEAPEAAVHDGYHPIIHPSREKGAGLNILRACDPGRDPAHPSS
jgi:hypothetical protein